MKSLGFFVDLGTDFIEEVKKLVLCFFAFLPFSVDTLLEHTAYLTECSLELVFLFITLLTFLNEQFSNFLALTIQLGGDLIISSISFLTITLHLNYDRCDLFLHEVH